MAPGSARGSSPPSGLLGRERLARLSDVLALLVLLRRLRADDRRARQLRGARLAALRVEGARRRAAVGSIAQRRAARAGGGDRRLAAEPRERQRAARVDLA